MDPFGLTRDRRGTVLEQISREVFAAPPPGGLLVTPEQIRAAQHDLITFAQVMDPDYRPNWHHRVIAKHLEQLYRGEIRKLMVLVPPQHGKALEVSTPIPTPDGWRAIGDLRPGDEVFDETGRPTQVVAVSPVWRDRPVVRVRTDDGDEIVADAAHEWLVRLCRTSKRYQRHESASLAARAGTRAGTRAPQVAAAGALSLPHVSLAIDPYVLGLWLGDGSAAGGTVYSAEADAAEWIPRVEAAGFAVRKQRAPFAYGILGLWRLLRENGLLHNKHIPVEYLRASAAQRLELLRGLVDSDGHVAKNGQVEICQADDTLARQIQELVRSLGVKCSALRRKAYLRGYTCQDRTRLTFYLRDCAHLERKRRYTRNAKKCGRYLTFEACGRADTVCIEVAASSHLFLCGRSMTPTCNSRLISNFFPAWALGQGDEAIVAAAYSATKSEAELAQVARLMASPVYRAIFPRAKIAERTDRLAGTYRGSAGFNLSGRPKAEIRAAGVGGPLTGYSKTLGIIDDPVKNWVDAHSETMRERVWAWYQSVYRTRDAALRAVNGVRDVLVMTPWHEDDLAGRLQKHEPGEWHICRLPALLFAADGDRDPDDPRSEGEALWPQMNPKENLEKLRARMPRVFQGLYQCRPRTQDEIPFRREKFGRYSPCNPPEWARTVLSVDATFGSDRETADNVALQVWGQDYAGRPYLVFARREPMKFIATLQAIRDLASIYHPDEILIENKANGPAIIDVLRTAVPNVVAYEPQGSKRSRAEAVSPFIDAGLVSVPHPEEAPWVLDFFTEVESWPQGAHDDDIDAMSQFLSRYISSAETVLGGWSFLYG